MLDVLRPKGGGDDAALFHLPPPASAIAKALVGKHDAKFIVEVLGDIYSAAKLAIAFGDPSFAADIIRTVDGLDGNLDEPLPAHLLPPPAYEQPVNLIDI